MGTDTESTADEFIRVMAELRALGEAYSGDTDSEERNAIRTMRHAAGNAIRAGLRTAQDLIAAAHEVQSMAAETKSAKAS